MQSQNTVMPYTMTWKILDICEEEVRHIGTWVYEWWWDQEGLVLAKAWEAAVTAGETEGVEVVVTGLGVIRFRRIKYQLSTNMV